VPGTRNRGLGNSYSGSSDRGSRALATLDPDRRRACLGPERCPGPASRASGTVHGSGLSVLVLAGVPGGSRLCVWCIPGDPVAYHGTRRSRDLAAPGSPPWRPRAPLGLAVPGGTGTWRRGHGRGASALRCPLGTRPPGSPSSSASWPLRPAILAHCPSSALGPRLRAHVRHADPATPGTRDHSRTCAARPGPRPRAVGPTRSRARPRSFVPLRGPGSQRAPLCLVAAIRHGPRRLSLVPLGPLSAAFRPHASLLPRLAFSRRPPGASGPLSRYGAGAGPCPGSCLWPHLALVALARYLPSEPVSARCPVPRAGALPPCTPLCALRPSAPTASWALIAPGPIGPLAPLAPLSPCSASCPSGPDTAAPLDPAGPRDALYP